MLDRIGISPVRVRRRRLLRRAVASPDRRRRGARRSSAATSTRGGRSSIAALEAIVVTASGCGVMVKDYGHFLAHDAAYAAKAKKIAELARDPIEIVTAGMEEDRAA